MQNNIVNVSDADMLSKICFITLDTSLRHKFQINQEFYETNQDVATLRTKEKVCFPDLRRYCIQNQENKQSKRRVKAHKAGERGSNQNIDCSHNTAEQDYIPDVWFMNVHHCQGFLVKNTKKKPNTVYAITQGTDDHSIVILEKVFLDSGEQCYKPEEIIYNLFNEFVKKIDIDVL